MEVKTHTHHPPAGLCSFLFMKGSASASCLCSRIVPLSFYCLGLLLFMALLTFLPQQKTDHKKHPTKRKRKQKKPPSSWDQIKNLLTCKQIEGSRVHDPSKSTSAAGYSKLGSSCGSICSFKDVAHRNTRVIHKSDNSSPESSTLGQETGLLRRKAAADGSSARSVSGSRRPHGGMTQPSCSRGMQFRNLSGCYECRMIVDPGRLPISRTTICACSVCGEFFPKMESLENHQAVRHAVSELGPEDSGRNIVEIIFKSSWLKKDSPICKIERILKVHNTQRTIQRFEDCRDAVKARALSSTKKNPRCAADGNELLRFHCTTSSCALGARGSSSLCGNIPGCGVCTIIRHGFKGKKQPGGGDCGGNGGGGNSTGVSAIGAGGGGGGGESKYKGVHTTAGSGRAHDSLNCSDDRRAMLVCRVIAGRVKRVEVDARQEEEGAMSASSYDSVAGDGGIYSNLEELMVFNYKAILACFVVIYKVLPS